MMPTAYNVCVLLPTIKTGHIWIPDTGVVGVVELSPGSAVIVAGGSQMTYHIGIIVEPAHEEPTAVDIIGIHVVVHVPRGSVRRTERLGWK